MVLNPISLGSAGVGTRVFLSYSRRDEHFAVWLRKGLEERGVEVFRDVDDTLPGEQWWSRLQGLIASADTIVFVLSPRSAASTVCRSEVEYAESLNKRIFPAVIEGVDWSVVPQGLAARHSIFFNDEGTYAPTLDTLVSALQTDLGWVREHTRLHERAKAWDAQSRLRHELLSGRALSEAENWLATQPKTAQAPTGLHREYVKASRDWARRLRRLATSFLAVGFLFAITLAGLAYWQRSIALDNEQAADRNARQAASERDVALTTQSRFLNDLARQQITIARPMTGALLALEGLPGTHTSATRPFVPEVAETLAAAERQLWGTQVDGAAGDISLSLDGKRLIFCDLRNISIFDAETLQRTAHILVADNMFDCQSILPTRRDHLIAVGMHTGVIKTGVYIFDMANGQIIETIADDYTAPSGSAIARLLLNRDESALFLLRHDNSGRMINLADKRILFNTPPRETASGQRFGAVWTPDHTRIVTYASGPLFFYASDTGQEISDLRVNIGRSEKIVFSPDGSTFATFWENTVHLWDTASWTRKSSKTLETGTVSEVCFNPDGSRLIVLPTLGRGFIWRHAELAPDIDLPLDDKIVTAAYSPDGNLMLLSSATQTRLWTDGAGEVSDWLNRSNNVGQILFTKDGRQIIGQVGEGIFAWRLTPRVRLSKYPTDYEITLDGTVLYSTGGDGPPNIIDARTRHILLEPASGTGHFSVADAKPNATTIATVSKASDGAMLRVWGATNGMLLKAYKELGPVSDVLLSADGSRLVALSKGEEKAFLINPVESTVLATFIPDAGSFAGMRVSRDGHRVAVLVQLSENERNVSRLHLHDGDTGRRLDVQADAVDRIGAIAFSKHGLMTVGLATGEVVGFDSENGHRLWSTAVSKYPITMIRISSDESVMSVVAGPTVELRSVADRKVIHSFTDPAIASGTTTFNASLDRLVTGNNQKIAIWDTHSGKPIWSIDPGYNREATAWISDDGAQLRVRQNLKRSSLRFSYDLHRDVQELTDHVITDARRCLTR